MEQMRYSPFLHHSHRNRWLTRGRIWPFFTKQRQAIASRDCAKNLRPFKRKYWTMVMSLKSINQLSAYWQMLSLNWKVTGVVRPGEFLAIMGASGAGKTTLLNCLTFRNSGKLKISGERYLNGAKVNTDTLARISGYVQQDDLFISTLTVQEHLRFHVSFSTHKKID